MITLDELPDLKANQPNPSAVISPESVTFDKETSHAQDITISLTLNGHQLTGISKGGVNLVSGQHYTASESTVVLKQAYMTTLPLGQTSLTFHFNHGKDAFLKLNVVDSSVVVVPPDSKLTIQAYNGNTSASTNGIVPKFKLINSGNTAINLSDVKVRYYYTIDGEQAQTFWSDWASVGSANVTSTFVKLDTAVTGADYYVELGFTSNAGVLNTGESAEVQARFSKNNWSNYNQADDYSFMATGNQYANHSKITGYVSDQLVWGVEP